MLTPLGAMRLAMDEARKGSGFVAPNPPVGAVIVDREGRFLSKGYHRVFGGDHAEIDALKNLERDVDPQSGRAVLEGATFYVTLEPCAHEGKTPSCAKKIATLPIQKVVYGCLDPNPQVRGKGLDILRASGITVESASKACGLTEAEDARLNADLEDLAEVFFYNQRENKPFVALKVATTLDGCLAHITGDSRWLTGEAAREHVHYLRAQYDAVLIGKETFLRDNPNLNIRHTMFADKKNKVIILDSRGGEVLEKLTSSNVKSNMKPNISRTHGIDDIFIATCASGGLRPQILSCEADQDGRISVDSLIFKAFEAGIRSILVEGGARTASSFLASGQVNRLYQFIAPQILGAKSGISFTQNYSSVDFASRLVLKNPRTQILGSDVMITGRLK